MVVLDRRFSVLRIKGSSNRKGPIYFNPIQIESFLGYSRIGGKKSPLPKICHTYPTIMDLGTVIFIFNGSSLPEEHPKNV